MREIAKNEKTEDVQEKKKCLKIYVIFPLKLYIKHHVYIQISQDPDGTIPVMLLCWETTSELVHNPFVSNTSQ